MGNQNGASRDMSSMYESRKPASAELDEAKEHIREHLPPAGITHHHGACPCLATKDLSDCLCGGWEGQHQPDKPTG